MASISFDKSTGWWSVRYVVSGVRRKKPLCKHPSAWSPSKPPRKPPAEVARLAEPYLDAERLGKLGQAVQVVALPLAPHVREYVAAYALTHRRPSVECLRIAAGKFLAFAATRKVATLQGVGAQLCADWIAARLADGAKPSTVRTERAYLARIWRVARQRRLVAENPWDFARVEGKPEEATPKFWTAEELVRLIGVLDGWLRDWLILDANTGLRVSALLGVEWRDVDFGKGTLTVRSELSKSGRSYSVPLTPAANEVLARRWTAAKGAGPTTPVFLNPKTGAAYKRNTVAHRIAYAVRKHGLRDFGHYAHAIRHSFAVALVEADVSIRVIQALLGHATIRHTEVYGKLGPGKLERALNGFEIRPPDDGTPPSSATPHF
jgi:integrase